jgi:hypothetical protein
MKITTFLQRNCSVTGTHFFLFLSPFPFLESGSNHTPVNKPYYAELQMNEFFNFGSGQSMKIRRAVDKNPKGGHSNGRLLTLPYQEERWRVSEPWG